MAYFEPSIDADGIHIPTYADIMEKLIADYKTIFGDDVYIGEETKDYQLLSLFARCLDDYAALVVDSYNSKNPNYASGNSLDLLLPLVSMERRAATYSTVTLALKGTAGMTVPKGSTAIDSNGMLWDTDADATFDANGDAIVSATCETAGAVYAQAGSINKIYSPMIGWTSVVNQADATAGKNIETDDEVRTRRKVAVALARNGTASSLMSSLLELNVNGESLSFANVVENSTGSTSDGIPAHSIACVVHGLEGHDTAIAEAIWKAKAPGIGTYGTTTVNYVDPYNHTSVIRFSRATEMPVSVTVNITTASDYDAPRCVPMIKEALKNEINSLGIGVPWGVTTAYRDIYNAFANERCPFVITSVTGRKGEGSAVSGEIACAYNEILTTSDAAITINAT